jgi:PAS domain S-box-containing protein
MQLSLFLVAVSFCSYAFLGWYVYRLSPSTQLNRRYASLSLFVAAWTLLQFVFTGSDSVAFEQRWYGNELFSYAPKTLLVLHYVLHLSGFRRRYPTFLLALQYLAASMVCVFGIGYLTGLPFGREAYRILSGGASFSPTARAIYAVFSVGQDAAAFVLLAIWHGRTKLRREKHMAAWHIALGVFIVTANASIGLLKGKLGVSDVDLILVLQIAQPFAAAFAIYYFQALKPTDSILSAHIRSQLTYLIAVLDADGRFLSANVAAEELSGQAEEQLIGRPLGLLFGNSEERMVDASDKATRFIERTLRGPGGENMPMSLSLCPLRDKWGDYLGHVVIGQPIRSFQEKKGSFGLSAREREVCLLLARGLSNQEIADRLFISPGTVKNHIYNIYEKTKVKNRVELARLVL